MTKLKRLTQRRVLLLAKQRRLSTCINSFDKLIPEIITSPSAKVISITPMETKPPPSRHLKKVRPLSQTTATPIGA
jgi:hypothetical protein